MSICFVGGNQLWKDPAPASPLKIAILLLEDRVIEWLDYAAKKICSRDELIAGCGDDGKNILDERFKDKLRRYKISHRKPLSPGRYWLPPNRS